jgi:hypothetical protein
MGFLAAGIWLLLMCQCSNLELAVWGAGSAAVAYFIVGPNPLVLTGATIAGILWKRSRASQNE